MDNNEIDNPLVVQSKGNDTTYELVPTSGKTVQPVALLRLSVFTPVPPKERGKRDFEADASEELGSLQLAKSEGYTNIKITGMKLSMSTDFKTWIAIIQAFSKYGFTSSKVELSFREFAAMCGFAPTDMNKRGRVRVLDSLANLSSVALTFRNKQHTKQTVTHLVQYAKLDMETDKVILVGDPDMWELYRYDHKVLLGLKALSHLSRKEAAQSLYIYFESMPPGTLYCSMKRLRERLAMVSPVKRQNQIVRAALEDLKNIGYLDFSEVKKGRDIQINIFKRSPRLELKG